MELLERDAGMRELEAGLASAIGGAARLVLVSGEAGIGKTALVRQFVEDESARVRTVWGGCDSQFTPRPLGPVHDIAAQLRGSLANALTSNAEPAALFGTALTELGSRPTVAVFEDVHWADEATLDLLGFFGRRIGGRPVLLILTYRDDELSPRHPLRLLLGDLTSSTIVRRINLAPLSEGAVRRLVGDRPVSALELHRRTGGNPFFVTEVLASSDSEVPLAVRDAVVARAARLSAAGQSALEASAIIGPRIELSLLTALGVDDPEAIDECLARGMLVADGDLLAFRHDLARQAILETIPPTRAARLHAMALAALRDAAGTLDLARLVHHAQGAGDGIAIVEYAPAAARAAQASGGHRDAATLYGLALRCADLLPPGSHAELLEAYAAECNVIDARAGAIAARRSAASLWQEQGNTQRQADNLARLVPMLLGVGDYGAARLASDQALELLDSARAGRELALAYRMRAVVDLAQRDAAQAIYWGNRSIMQADLYGDAETAAMAHVAVGSAWLLLDYSRGCAYMQRRLEVGLQTGQHRHVANVLSHFGRRLAELYYFETAERTLAQGIAFTEGRHLDMYQLYMLAWQSLTLMHLGRWREAAEVGQRVLLRTGMSSGNRIPALVAIGRLHARGGLDDGQFALDDALEAAQSIGTAETVSMVRAARAERAWLLDDQAGALAEACAGYELAVQQRHTWVAGELAFWRWQAGDALTEVDGLAEPYCLQITGDWRAAADAWQRLGCPYEMARALIAGDDGARREALEILQRLGARGVASRLARELRAGGRVPVPRGPFPTTRANPFGLTARQVDILALIGDNLTNAEIASRLGISAKTVDHHVGAVLAKLGVHSRKAAAVLALEQGVYDRNREVAGPI